MVNHNHLLWMLSGGKSPHQVDSDRSCAVPVPQHALLQHRHCCVQTTVHPRVMGWQRCRRCLSPAGANAPALLSWVSSAHLWMTTSHKGFGHVQNCQLATCPFPPHHRVPSLRHGIPRPCHGIPLPSQSLLLTCYVLGIGCGLNRLGTEIM